MLVRAVRLLAATAIAAVAATATAALAQSFPSQRITLLIGIPPGASGDTIGRLLADKLKDRFNQPVVVENRVGGGGIISAEALVRSPADGHTAMLTFPAIGTAPLFLKSVAFDPMKDFTWLGRVAYQPYLLIVNSDLNINSMADLIRVAKASPGKLNYGSVPNSLMQLDQARLMKLAGIDMTEVPFNGAAPITQAQLSGQVQLQFGGTSALPHIKDGKLKAIAVSGRERLPIAPDVPTTHEAGVNFDSDFWYGMALPGGTPRPVVDRWVTELQAVMKMDDVREAIRKTAMLPLLPSPDENAETVRREMATGAEIAKALGVTPK
jgi:tripartite-type tricarboxylate transporter receptor subunit TctC